jgi:O-antigen ligase
MQSNAMLTLPPPPALQKTMYIWFLLFGIVLFEPAPFDALFLPVVFLTFVYNRLYIPQKMSWLRLWIGLFAIANLLAVFPAFQVGRAFFFLSVTLYMLLFCIFIAVLVYNYGFPMLDNIMSAYVAIAVVSSVIGILAMTHLLPAAVIEYVTAYDATRAKALFKDPNVYAPFLVFAMVYALDKFWHGGAARMRWFAVVVVLLLGILVSFSRGAWGAALFSIIAYFVLTAVAQRNFVRLASSAFVVFGMLAVGLVLVGVFAQEADMSEFIEKRAAMQSYDEDRFTVQKLALLAGLKQPLGIGPGQSENAFVEFISHGQMTGATHSLYVRVFTELGFLGALSFLCLLLITIRRALWLCMNGEYEKRPLYCVFTTVLFATLVNSVVIDSLHWRHFFLVIGVLWGLFARERSVREQLVPASTAREISPLPEGGLP